MGSLRDVFDFGELEDFIVKTVKSALALSVEIDASQVPKNSLIREFISGGIYHEVYG